MRVITGTARGVPLKAPRGMDTRPTMDQVKEGIFSAIQFEVEGRTALDLFAGSGQLGIDPATGKLPEGVAAQTEQSLKNIRALLAAAGAGIENVVKTTVFITNMADFPLVNAEYSKVFAENPPARSCVAVKELPLGGLVEIEVLAVV